MMVMLRCRSAQFNLAKTVLFIFSLGIIFPLNSQFAQAKSVCEKHIIAAGARYNVPVGVLYAVGLTETGRKGSLHAYALNVAGKAYFPSSRSKAIIRFNENFKRGITLIDLGCMQINYKYHHKEFKNLKEMFNPKLNVEYAAKFLSRLRKRHGTWAMAVARYHAGPNNNPAQKRYICRVISNMVATGFGKWTPNAKKFCG